MAGPAGMVNSDGSANDATFTETLSESPGGVRRLARAVRELVYDVYPETIEVVWPKQGSVGWGVGPKRFTEQFAYLMPFKGHVTLGFYHGGELPDPDGLLPDAGGKQVSETLSMRSVRIEKLDDVSRPALRELLEAAVRHQVSLTRD